MEPTPIPVSRSNLDAPTFDRSQSRKYQGINEWTDRARNPKCFFYLEAECKRWWRKERVRESEEKGDRRQCYLHCFNKYFFTRVHVGWPFSRGVAFSQELSPWLSHETHHWALSLAFFDCPSQQRAWETILHLLKDPKSREILLNATQDFGTYITCSFSELMLTRLRFGKGTSYSSLLPLINILFLIRIHCN